MEKIRYRKRLKVEIEAEITNDVKIAPLILLTLLENACKHSTREELNEAKISISLKTEADKILAAISNTKPKRVSSSKFEQDKVGLSNLKKQLALLYPNQHSFEVVESDSDYTAKLSVEQQ